MMGTVAIATARARQDRRRSIGSLFIAAAATLMLAALGSRPAFAQGDRFVERLNGQTVAPAYDGFEINPDGTYSMWFSYFNRNREERLDVAVGPDNRFEPGPPDRGQPTHFVPLWQKSSFRVVLPKDWGDKKLTWFLTTHGQTNQVVATLNPKAMIDRQKETLEGGEAGENKAPQVNVEPKSQTTTVSGSVSFTVSATDDGKPANRATKKPEGLNVRWRKFRGPPNGRVSFTPAAAALVDGKSATTATFSEPGEYVVQAIVDDGSLLSGTYCCWINTELKVTVTDQRH
jgi:hypothetical protein